MGRRILYPALLLALFLLAGCGQQGEQAPEQYIEPAQLTAEEEKIAKLLGYEGDARIFDFFLDDSVQSMKEHLYELVDGQWKELTGGSYAVESGAGRIALEFERLDGPTRIAFQQGEGYSAVSHDRGTAPDGLGVGTSCLSQREEISCGAEIPLVVQVMTSKSEMSLYGVEGFQEPERYAEQGHEHVYAFTVSFHQEALD